MRGFPEYQRAWWTPIAARARESARPDAVLIDPAARRLADDAPPGGAVGDGRVPELGICLRARLIDDLAREALADGPAAAVELGAGSSTRRSRIGARVPWFCLDRAEAGRWRERRLQEEGAVVVADLEDRAWTEAVRRRAGGGPFLFIAEGVFQFLAPETVRAVMADAAADFPGSLLLFDAVSPAAGKILPGGRWFPESPAAVEALAPAWQTARAADFTDLPANVLRRVPRGTRLAWRLFPPLRRSHLALLLRPRR
ncbi:MAG TPA: class I SAM-dependent methyltransferase [bacterium]|nr:class I SAM-dependent methyltransferase [bacterium]HPQ66526.1 class I SAM-dependent methyltransferase [bacterium]